MSVCGQEAEEPGAESRLRNLPPKDLLEQLPVMQRLMQRLMDCMPKGAAARDWVVQMALLTVAKESFQVWPCDGRCYHSPQQRLRPSRPMVALKNSHL